jgi:hypothetical protein
MIIHTYSSVMWRELRETLKKLDVLSVEIDRLDRQDCFICTLRLEVRATDELGVFSAVQQTVQDIQQRTYMRSKT